MIFFSLTFNWLQDNNILALYRICLLEGCLGLFLGFSQGDLSNVTKTVLRKSIGQSIRRPQFSFLHLRNAPILTVSFLFLGMMIYRTISLRWCQPLDRRNRDRGIFEAAL